MKIFKALIIFLFTLFLATPATGHPSHNRSYKVERQLTPISRVELARALKEGHYKVFKKYPSENRLAVAWAQIAIENLQGKIVYNHNLGNIKSSKHRPYYVKVHRFRAHQSFLEGAVDYWKIINKMCKSSLPAFDAGAPRWAAKRLKACGYYEADTEKYGKAMSQLYFTAKRKVLPKL